MGHDRRHHPNRYPRAVESPPRRVTIGDITHADAWWYNRWVVTREKPTTPPRAPQTAARWDDETLARTTRMWRMT